MFRYAQAYPIIKEKIPNFERIKQIVVISLILSVVVLALLTNITNAQNLLWAGIDSLRVA